LLEHQGYLVQVASSRRLEREARRNPKVMRLTGRLAGAGRPDELATARREVRATMGDAGAPHLNLHWSLGRKTDQLAQNIRFGALFHGPTQSHHLIGHHWPFGLEFELAI
jgi:hypothetical protein